jgi:hypothetical protein
VITKQISFMLTSRRSSHSPQDTNSRLETEMPTGASGQVAQVSAPTGNRPRFRPDPAVGFGYPAAAELAAPEAGCWVLTAVVVHYHVGIRHYVVTDPDGLVVCIGTAAINAATNAAIAAGPR